MKNLVENISVSSVMKKAFAAKSVHQKGIIGSSQSSSGNALIVALEPLCAAEV